MKRNDQAGQIEREEKSKEGEMLESP